MDWKSILRTLAHGFVSAAAVTVAGSVQSGAAITSRNVIIPAVAAGILGAIHGAFPSSVGADTQDTKTQ